jgi:hypothetical protein
MGSQLVFYLPEEKFDIKIDDITDWFPIVSHIIHQQVAHRSHDSLYNKTGTDKKRERYTSIYFTWFLA